MIIIIFGSVVWLWEQTVRMWVLTKFYVSVGLWGSNRFLPSGTSWRMGLGQYATLKEDDRVKGDYEADI